MEKTLDVHGLKIDFRTYYNDPSFPYNEALELYRQSFEEHTRRGIVFMISKFTREQLIAELMDTYILAAFHEGRLIAVRCMRIRERAHGAGPRFCKMVHLAVAHDMKHRGIATVIDELSVELALNEHCEYMKADTSVKAVNSVRWHLKNGYRIVDVRSYRQTKYYSYVFRKQLKKGSLWGTAWFCALSRALGYVFCHLTKRADGTSRFSFRK